MMKKFSIILAFGLAVTLPSAFAATALAPGGSVTPVPGSGSVPGTLVADTGVIAFTEGGAGGGTAGVSGTYRELVIRNAGMLDFFFQLSNTTAPPRTDAFNELSLLHYSGFTTAVDYLTNPPFTGTAAPTSSSRGPGVGDTVNFFFQIPGADGEITSGTTANWVEIDTNATMFSASGQQGVIDGGGFTIDAASGFTVFGPTSTTPEPVSMTLLGGGLALLGLARWRKSGKKS